MQPENENGMEGTGAKSGEEPEADTGNATEVPQGAPPFEVRKWLTHAPEDTMPLFWVSDQAGNWSWVSPQWTAFTGLNLDASVGRGWLNALHPEDRETALSATERAENGYRTDCRVRQRSSGAYRWFCLRASEIRNAPADGRRWFGSATNSDDLHRLLDEQHRLMAETQHRVRNNHFVMRSIIRRTSEASRSVEDFTMHLEGRLDALTRIQTATTTDPTIGVDLSQIVAEELLAEGFREDEQVHHDGPELRLKPRMAEPFALAVHELTQNAIKFGALSTEGGALTVNWWIEGASKDAVLVFDWRERTPDFRPPERVKEGFGFDLLRRMLRYQIGAETVIDLTDSGLSCTIRMRCEDVETDTGEGR